MSKLQIHIHHKIFPGNAEVILKNFILSAETGDFIGIVGPSGAGKSTLLNIIGGLDSNFDGQVCIDGKQSDVIPHYGYMFQEPRLMPWLTVSENINLVLEKSVANIEFVQELLVNIGLQGYAKAYPMQLSGGMQRRVALARAFAVRPALLLMDEPFLSLDVPTAERLRMQLLTLWQELRPTVLFVTHDLHEALALSDRVIFMSHNPGHVVMEFDVDLPRPRELHGAAINDMHDALLAENPDLLAGLAAESKGQDSSRNRRIA